VDAVAFAASSEESRGSVLMSTLCEIAGDRMTMVATDGYRLAKRRIALSEALQGNSLRHIVPARALSDVARSLGNAERIDVSALGGRNQLRFSAGHTSITVRLVEGQYPNYEQVIPSSFAHSVTVNTAAFIGALKRAELIAGDRANMVTVKISDHRLIVTASSDTVGNAYEEMEIEQNGADIAIAFNAKYLIEILSHVEAPQAVLELLGPLNPVAIKPASETDQLHVLMPLRK
jgi:DNA polymerase-3 subunit beta